jgi:hypothetical protein
MFGSSSMKTLAEGEDEEQGGGSLQSFLHGAQLDFSSNSTTRRSCEEFGSSLRSLCRSHSVRSQHHPAEMWRERGGGADHRECFPTSSLSIRDDACVVSI